MRILKILLISIVVSVFLVGQAYSAPKGNNGKSNKANNGNVNNGKAQAAKGNNGNNNGGSQARGQAAVHKQQARRAQEVNRRREERNRPSQRNLEGDNGNNDLAFNNRNNRANNQRRNGADMKKEKADRVIDLLDALNRARWSHNPHDTRGQGNMGKVDMLDPFGHDKDSDRKELYGNNGRPIRVDEEPEVVEELPPEELPVTVEELALLDATIDFSSLYDMQWLVDWYNRVMANYDPNDPNYDYYQALWYNHFFPGGDLNTTTGIRLNNVWDSSDRYFYGISLNSFDGDSLIVTTTMTLTEGYTGYSYYNLDGSWSGEYSEHEAGEVVYEQTEELSVDSTSGTITVGVTADSDLVDIAWGSDEVYVDLVVTLTDPSTGATYTQTYDQSLYLYRCPYGKITDKGTGQAIVGAKITVHYEDGSIVSLDKAANKTASNPQITDVTGRFGFILQSNRKYYMVASAEGYEDYQSDIFTEQWHVLREDVKMVPKREQIASNVE